MKEKGKEYQDKNQMLKLQSVRGRRKCVLSTHILMLHVFEQSQLSVGPLSKDL